MFMVTVYSPIVSKINYLEDTLVNFIPYKFCKLFSIEKHFNQEVHVMILLATGMIIMHICNNYKIKLYIYI